MANTPMMDLSLMTPDTLRAAGIHPARFQQQLANPGIIPVTQGDRDELGRVRNRKLRVMKITAVIMLLVSTSTIVVGFVSMMKSSTFPYKMGFGVMAGSAGLITSLISVCMLKEGKKTPTGSETTSCMVVLFKFHLIVGIFVSQIMMVSFGIGGIWGTVECLNRRPSDDTASFSINGCHPNTSMLLALSLLTLILCSVLLVVFLISSCSFCCNSRAFGVKSGAELLMDIQMARLAEMQNAQQQQQLQQGESIMYGPQAGQYPQPQDQGLQGYDTGQQYHYGTPSAPYRPVPFAPMEESNDDDPPSYYDVMKK